MWGGRIGVLRKMQGEPDCGSGMLHSMVGLLRQSETVGGTADQHPLLKRDGSVDLLAQLLADIGR